MKILVVCQYYFPENFVITNIAEELSRLGHDVSVLTGQPNYGYGHILPEYRNVFEETINGVRVHRVKILPRKQSRLSIVKNYLSFWKNSKKWIRKTKEKFDVVYSMSLSPVTILSAGNLYKRKHHVKHVVHCVDLWPESVLVTKAVRKKSLVYKLLYFWSKKLYSHADRVLVGSPSFKEYLTCILKLKDEMIEFVPQPSLVEKFSGQKVELPNGLNILYCGNLGTIQNIDLLPKALEIIKTHEINFHVIGMGPKAEEFQNKIFEKHLENKVFYYGPMSAKKAEPYFASVDFLYLSLSSEGYVGKTIPNKLMMYMALGKPIIAALEGDGKDILINSGGAILCEQNASSIANAFIKALELSNEEMEFMGKRNEEYYNSHFSTSTVAGLIEKYLI